MLGGLSSDNKYALLGSLRAAAQMVSYEVLMGISLLGVVALSGSFNLRTIVEAQEGMWFVVPQFVGFVIFLIAGPLKAIACLLIFLRLNRRFAPDTTLSIQA